MSAYRYDSLPEASSVTYSCTPQPSEPLFKAGKHVGFRFRGPLLGVQLCILPLCVSVVTHKGRCETSTVHLHC